MINIAELLKDAPEGMKLYSPLFGDVEYCYIGGTNRRIWVCTKASMRMFSMDGRYCFTHDGNTIESTECLLFPSKECRTWEGWKATVEPKFKAEDRIVNKSDKSTIYRIIALHEELRKYIVDIEHKDHYESCPWIAFEDQDDYELAPKPHYDISNFQPFDKVLVRDNNTNRWGNTYFGFYDEEHEVFVCDCCEWDQCIPYNDDTKHLLGTTDMCDEMYINW